jgi:hypothetical protein
MTQLHKDEPDNIKDALKNVGYSLGQLSDRVIQGITRKTPTIKTKLRTLRLKSKAAWRAFCEEQPKVKKTIDAEKVESED